MASVSVFLLLGSLLESFTHWKGPGKVRGLKSELVMSRIDCSNMQIVLVSI